jgi:y4mF family transcriptional regulator
LHPSHLSDYFPIRKYHLLYVIIGVIIPEGEIFMITKIDTPISLGLAVRTARKRLALTQPQLALASGVGVRFIVELEAGKPTLRLENVLRVLHALGGSLCVEGLEKGQED